MLTVIGRTEDGRDVLGGLYEMYSTHGIPLDVLVEKLNEQGKVIGWMNYVDSAVKDGISKERACGRAIEACGDALGSEHAEEVKKRFRIAGYL